MTLFPPLPAHSAHATHILWEPVIGSGERITAAVALKDNHGSARVISLLSPEILSVLYREQGENAHSMMSIVTNSLKDHLLTSSDLASWTPPLSGFFSQPLREYYGASDADIIDQVAGLHSSLYKTQIPKAIERPVAHKDETIRRLVKEVAKQRYGLRADSIFTQNGIIEVREQSKIHHLPIPIKTAGKVGSIMSAWYHSAHTIETHFLRAQSNLAVASERGKFSPGLFISMPETIKSPEIENMIDNIYWRLRKTGCYLEVRETPEALADEIMSWAS